MLHDRSADASRADDADRGRRDIEADLALEAEVLDKVLALDELDLPCCHHHEHDCVVRDALRRVGGMGDLHAELVCIRDIDVVVADRTGCDGLDTKLMELVKDLGRHRIRDDGYCVSTFGKLEIGSIRVVGRPGKLESLLLRKVFHIAKLVVGTQRIGKELHDCTSSFNMPCPSCKGIPMEPLDIVMTAIFAQGEIKAAQRIQTSDDF